MRRDLHARDLICYLGEQELERTQAPQLEVVIRHMVLENAYIEF